MRSVADKLRRELIENASRLTAGECVSLALALGDADAATLASYRRISETEARRILERARHRGRLFSASHESLLR